MFRVHRSCLLVMRERRRGGEGTILPMHVSGAETLLQRHLSGVSGDRARDLMGGTSRSMHSVFLYTREGFHAYCGCYFTFSTGN